MNAGSPRFSPAHVWGLLLLLVAMAPAQSRAQSPGTSRAIVLDGMDDEVVLADAAFDFGGSFTVSFWVKVDGSFETLSVPLVAKGDESWKIRRVGTERTIAFVSQHEETSRLEGRTPIDDDTWHHVAVVYDARTGEKNLYVDGVREGSATVSGALQLNDDSVRVGSNTDRPDAHFGGQIDDLRFWTTARSQTEIQHALWHPLQGNEPDLLAYYPADAIQSVADTRSLADAGPNDISGVLRVDVGLSSTPTPRSLQGIQASVGVYEDRVRLGWPDPADFAPASALLRVERDGEVLAYRSAGDTTYSDDTGGSDVSYEYCLTVETNGATYTYDCAEGERSFNEAVDVTASDELFTDQIELTWADRSQVEAGYRLYRDGEQIAELDANAQQYVDSLSLEPRQSYRYCVAPFDEAGEGEIVCDTGALAEVVPVASVSATMGEYENRVILDWTDTGTGTTGFVLTRNDTELATLTRPDVRQYTDTTSTPGTTYEYCIERLEGTIASRPLCVDGSAGTLAAPTDVAASDTTHDDRVELQWTDAATAESRYVVYRRPGDHTADPDSTEMTQIATLSTDGASFVDSEAAPGQRYTYCVVAATEKGARTQLSGTDPVGRTVDACDTGTRSTVLAPTEVTATDSTFETRVRISWTDPATRSSFYRIYRRDADTSAYTAIATPPKTTRQYVDETAPPNAPHDYCVTAITKQGAESSRTCDVGSREVRNPTGVTATDDEREDRVEVTWTDNSAVEQGFRVYRRPLDEDGTPSTADSTLLHTTIRNEVVLLDTTGTPGRDYRYSVAAVTVYDGDSLTTGASTDPGRRTLRPPTAVEAQDGDSETRVVVTWEDNSAAEDGYRIWRERVSTGNVTEAGTVASNVTDFEDTGGMLAERYVYRVAAFDRRGTSTTDEDEGFTKILPPGSVSASDDYNDRVTVTWVDRSTREANYRVYRDGTPTDTLGADATTTTDTGIADGTSARYCVETVSAGGKTSDRVCDSGTRTGTTSGGGTSDIVVLSETIEGSDTDFYEQFGDDLDATDTYLGVGHRGQRVDQTGTAHIYERKEGAWEEIQELGAPDANNYGRFGSDIGIGDEVIVIGESKVNRIVEFTPSSGGWGNRNLILSGPQNDSVTDEVDIAVDGKRAAVAYSDQIVVRNTETGALTEPFGGGTLIETGSSGLSWDRASVALLGDRLLVGDTDRSNVYYFEQTASGDWDQALFFSESGDYGGATALTDEHVIVGNPTAASGEGRVYVYNLDGDLEQTLTPRTDGSSVGTANFGAQIHAEPGGLLLIGAPEQASAGRAHLYQQEEGRYERRILFSPQGNPSSAGFGRAVAYGAGSAIISAPDVNTFTGAVYVTQLANAPSAFAASDGEHRNRVSLSWKDESTADGGYRIYRNGERIATTGPDATSYRDTDTSPGDVYEYCITAYNSEADFESDPVCDRGWRFPDGTISGRVELRDGSAFEGVNVCLSPNPNGALVFDGSGGYAIVDDLAPDVPAAFTVSAWVKPSESGTSTLSRRAVWAVNTANGENKNILFYSYDAQRFQYYDGGPRMTTASTDTFAPNEWHHVAVAITDADEGRLYVDGTLQATFDAPSQPVGRDLFSIGQEFDEAGASFRRSREASDFWRGQIDDVRLWNEVRTADQIDSLRNEPLEGTEDGLMAYWPLDERAGTAAANVVGEAGNYYAVHRGGVSPAEEGAPLDACLPSRPDGSYNITDLRYGDGTAFTVIPKKEPHTFQPARTTVTLNPNTPVQNKVRFIDQTSIPVSGAIQYAGTECPVEQVEMQVDGEQDATTDTQGAYSVGVIPGSHTIAPVLNGNGSGEHTFQPSSRQIDAAGEKTGVDFEDTTTRRLTVDVHGGCGFEVGVAELQIRSTNGCYSRTVETDDGGIFTADLPPQEYTLQVTGVRDVPDPSQKVRIEKYFAQLGAINVDLAARDTTVELIYRAPLNVSVKNWPEPPTCDLEAPVVERNQEFDFEIEVAEDYGNGNLCPVDSASVTIYDELADKADEPLTYRTDSTGTITHHTFGRSPNLIEGRVVNGVDRSYQKSFSAVGSIEARRDETTRWAVVEGLRQRKGTQFVTRAVDFPISVLRDPPGDQSYSYLESGKEVCRTVWSENTESLASSLGFVAGVNTEVEGGWWPLYTDVEVVATVSNVTTVSAGTRSGSSFSVCRTINERLSTSAAPSATGPPADVFMGAGINFVFATSDVLQVKGEDSPTCDIERSQTVSFQPDSISTTYAYTRRHVEDTLIPDLEGLKESDDEGRLDYDAVIRMWEHILYESDSLASEAELIENRSISGDASYEYQESEVETSTSSLSSFTSIVNETAIEAGTQKPVVAKLVSGVTYTTASSSGSEESETNQTTWGYQLSDDDAGDAYTVDVKRDPTYGTPAFRTRSGVSSCPYEPWRKPYDSFSYFSEDRTDWNDHSGELLTTRRDQVGLLVSNGISRKSGVAPDEAATFPLSLVNDSGTDEDRDYALRLLNASNPKGAIVKANGASISNGIPFTVSAGEARNITLTVERGARGYDYDSLAVMTYAPCGLSGGAPSTDTVHVSVQFTPPSSPIALESPEHGFAVNRATKDEKFDASFSGFSIDTTDTGHLLSEIGIFYRPAQDLEGGLTMAKAAAADSLASDTAAAGRYFKDEAARRLFARLNDSPRAKAEQGVEALEDWTRVLAVASRRDILAQHGCEEACDLEDITTYFKRTQFQDEDGVYEIAAYTKTTTAEGTVTGAYVSDPVRIVADTKRPRVQGSPAPSDGLLTPGDDVSITFDEDIDCTTLRANENVTLAYADSTAGEHISVTPTCDGRVVTLQPEQEAALDAAEDETLVAAVKSLTTDRGAVQRDPSGPMSLTDPAGNPLPDDAEWRFSVQRSGLVWSPPADTVTLTRGTTVQLDIELGNYRNQLVDYALENTSEAVTIAGETADPDPLSPGASRTVEMTLTADARPGTYVDTIQAVGVGADPVRFRLTTVIEFPEPAVRTPGQVTASATNARQVEVTWAPVDDEVARYQLYRGPTSHFDTTDTQLASLSTGATRYVDTTAATGRTHYYRLIARNQEGEQSRPSEAATVFLYPTQMVVAAERTFDDAQDPHDYRLVALPGVVHRSLAETIPGTPGEDWTAFGDTGAPKSPFVSATNETLAFAPGRGYWLRHADGWSVKEQVGTVPLRGDTVAVLDLHDGWNIIANPLEKDVDWPVVEQATGANLQTLWRFSGRYEPMDVFPSARTGEALYFLNDRGLDSLVVPYPGAPFREAPSETVQSKSASSSDRSLTLDVYHDGVHTSQATLRLHGAAKEGRDSLDQVAPPSRFEGVRLRAAVAEPQTSRRRWLAQEARPADTKGERFNLMLDAAPGTSVRIDTRDVAALDVEAVRLVRRATGRSYDLTKRQSVSVEPRAEQTDLVLLVGTAAYVEEAWSDIVPPEVTLRPNYPNPIRSQTTLEYAVPEAASVQLEVYDVLGRRVATLVHDQQEAGWHRVQWNPDAGGVHASGVYFGRLRVGEQVRTQKMVIVR